MYLGLDLGTSGLKAVLIDENQVVAASATAPLAVKRPHPGWSEQDPWDWITAAEAVLSELQTEHPNLLAAVAGIGLSGQMHGATVLDSTDKPLRPAILWNDTRSHKEAAELDADPRFRSITGNIVFPGFTAPKLAWMRTNEPELFSKAARVLLPKDYLRLWLTGESVSDMSDSAGTSWLDVGARAWSSELLGATDLSEAHMPRLVEGTEVSGTLRPDLASRFGMQRAVVAGGGGDNAASAVGMGTVTPDAGFVSLGTSGVVFVSNARFSPDPASAVHAFCHSVPGQWHQMGVILSATDTLNWFSGLVGQEAAKLVDGLGSELNGPTGLTCLPYLAGERTPHNDAEIRGAFVGLGHETDAGVMTEAVLEGISFALADNLAALSSAGAAPRRLMAVGGGSRSSLWLKMLATILDMPIDVPQDGDFGGAFGAARLGLIAATGASVTDVCTPPPVAASIDPVASLSEAYKSAYARYRALYPAVKGLPR
ncbi:xylulokinase [Algicella marina]|uniref:Xylulose kinase n=1 Tax=Algicella marina TaxID=2683284 RepID=A0A6P1T438_9RHOB|nr:xylulokinase [Algicella marina]QHQ36029.1 xylulokinase [Algicella marina]